MPKKASSLRRAALLVTATLLTCASPVLAGGKPPAANPDALPVLWPPDHAMIDVALDIIPADMPAVARTVTINVFCNEPDDGTGDGATADDVGELHLGGNLEFRAERQGNGDGRIYVVEVIVKSNRVLARRKDTVVVPHSASRKAVVGVLDDAIIAEMLNHAELADAGFVLLKSAVIRRQGGDGTGGDGTGGTGTGGDGTGGDGTGGTGGTGDGTGGTGTGDGAGDGSTGNLGL